MTDETLPRAPRPKVRRAHTRELLLAMARGARIRDRFGGPVTHQPRGTKDRFPWVSQSGAFRYSGKECHAVYPPPPRGRIGGPRRPV